MTIPDGLSALDEDRSSKLKDRRPPRHVPKPKYARDEAVGTPEELQTETPVVNLRESAPETAAQSPSEAAPAAPRPKPASRQPTSPAPIEQPKSADDRRLRQAQLYLDGKTDEHLRHIKAAGLVRNIDATYSAVVRHAVAEFVETHGYDGIAELLSADPVSERGRGRPRR